MKIDPRKNTWQQALVSPSLQDGEIHVWRADLNPKADAFEKLLATLSADEKEKAERYRFSEDRRRFIAARGALRKILGGYLGLPPSEIRFAYNRYGKPTLAETVQDLRFNVSHSGETALVAAARGREIGVDLEFVKNDFSLLKAAASFLSDTEMSDFRELPQDVQLAVFFSVWTRKEAYLKAVGEGFSYPPKRFSVSLRAEKEEILSSDSQMSRFWSVLELPFETDYRAAIAVEGAVSEIRLWRWTEN